MHSATCGMTTTALWHADSLHTQLHVHLRSTRTGAQSGTQHGRVGYQRFWQTEPWTRQWNWGASTGIEPHYRLIVGLSAAVPLSIALAILGSCCSRAIQPPLKATRLSLQLL